MVVLTDDPCGGLPAAPENEPGPVEEQRGVELSMYTIGGGNLSNLIFPRNGTIQQTCLK